MRLRTFYITGAISLALMLAFSAYAWVTLPDDARIPVHWGIDGEPDRYGSKAEGLLLTPVIALVIVLLLAILPRIEPRRANLQQSRRAYVAVGIGLLVFLLMVHAWLVASALGYRGNSDLFFPILVGALFFVIGLVLGRVKSNFFMGIRTPWTLSSEASWEKTHRLGGILFLVLGLFMILGALFLQTAALIPWFIAASLGMVAVLLVYSYLVWRNDPDKQQFGR